MQALQTFNRGMKFPSSCAREVSKQEVCLAGLIAVGVIGELPGTCVAFV